MTRRTLALLRACTFASAGLIAAATQPCVAQTSALSKSADSASPAKAPLPELYGPLGVTAAAVKQGQLGSCYFHAAIAAIANHNPATIQNAIEDPGDHTFVVHFADGSKETVSLDDIAYARDNQYDRSDGLWVTVLLRGIAQSTLRKALLASIQATQLPDSAKAPAAGLIESSDAFVLAYDRAIRSVLYQDGTIDKGTLKISLTNQAKALSIPSFFTQPVIDFLDSQGFFTVLAAQIHDNGELFGAYRAVGQGGMPTRVMATFGIPGENMRIPASDAARALVLKAAGEGAPAMIATTADSIPQPLIDKIKSREAPSWFVPDHAYTVLGYDASTDSMKLRNPWGRMPEPSGVFSLPMNDFLVAFTDIDYAK
jgi:hypothetical protein